MKKLITTLGIIAISLSGLQAGAAQFRYADGSCDRNNMFRLGTTTRQGAAIRLSKEKVQALKGCKITSISASVASTRTTDGTITLFIGTSPDSPAMTQSVDASRALKWLDFELDNPYTITGDEPELYIGFSGEISTSASLLMHDGNSSPAACCYAFENDTWIDMAGSQWGAPNVSFEVADSPALTDLVLKPILSDGYYKAENGYKFGGQIFNFGTETINSFDLQIAIGDTRPVVTTYKDLTLAPGENFDFILDEYASASTGHQPMSVEVLNVNGADDSDQSDNLYEANLFFYPSDMERAFLLEGFTGQECSNCPPAHVDFERFLEDIDGDPVIEVMHHSGYKPDYFSMDADYDYTFFYGVSNTYAPAMMFNRTQFPSIATYPAMGVSLIDLQRCYDILSATQPYVSMELNSTFDPGTRAVTVKLNTLTHNDMPTTNNIINVMLVQDGITHYQSNGGGAYVHNAVFRGVLTGNSWGKLLPSASSKAGGGASWEYEFTLPEAIFSDYWANELDSEEKRKPYTITAVPENMRIVAYIGSLGGNDVNNHQIYNAIEVKLGESHVQNGMISGIETVATDLQHPDVKIGVLNGAIVIEGEYDAAEAYNLQGARVPLGSPLAGGIYMVKCVSEGKSIVKKILVK